MKSIKYEECKEEERKVTDAEKAILGDQAGKEEAYLFSGDIILGTPSTSVQDLSDYMETLYALRKEEFKHICLPHSTDMTDECVIVSGKQKLEDYIKYREDRDKAIIACFSDPLDKLTKQELYDVIYGSRNLVGGLKVAAMNNLELHLGNLVKKQIIKIEPHPIHEKTDIYSKNEHAKI